MIDGLPSELMDKIIQLLDATARARLSSTCVNGRNQTELVCQNAFRAALADDIYMHLDERRRGRSWTRCFAKEHLSIEPSPTQALAWFRKFHANPHINLESASNWNSTSHEPLATESSFGRLRRQTAPFFRPWFHGTARHVVSAPKYAWMDDNLDSRILTPDSSYHVTKQGIGTRVEFNGLWEDSRHGGSDRRVDWLVTDHFRPYVAACCPPHIFPHLVPLDPEPGRWRIGIYDLSAVSKYTRWDSRTNVTTPLQPCLAHFYLPFEPESLRLWVGENLLKVFVKHPAQEIIDVYRLRRSEGSHTFDENAKRA